MKKLILAFICLFLAIPSQARVITVDDDGPADFDNIQAAIDDSDDGDTIIVATGTYTGFGSCCIDFLGKAITVRSTDPNDPNIVAETVISCYGAFYGFWFHTAEGPNSVLAGVTIINGSELAAICCSNASPTITNCAITGYPPAYYNSNGIICESSSSPTITNCTITDNTARGIVCWDNSNPTISSCEISNNGGGIFCSSEYVPSSAPIITDCTIKANAAYLSSAHDYGCGGGIANSEGPVTNCTVTSNTAGAGGGLYNCSGPITGCIISDNSSSERRNGGGLCECNGPITNCTISGNTAGENGGGLYECNGPITNCIIKGNSAGDNGGGLARCYGPVTNCFISGNTAGEEGGGMRGCYTIKNCTIAGNFAGDYGGGVLGGEITNCIIWGNQPDQVDSRVTYSNVQGGYEGEGNIDADPLFALGTDYHIMPSSPCINAGDPNYIPEPNETDLDGNPRVIGGRIDMGAYEHTPNSPSIAVSAKTFYFTQDWPEPEPQTLLIRNADGGTLHWEIVEDCNWLQVSPVNGVSTYQINEVTITVDPNGFAPGLYSYDFDVQDPNASNNPVTVRVTMPVGQVLPVPSQDFNTIQDAIDAADNYDIVLVADGNYIGEGNKNLDFKEKPITVCSENGPNNCIINCENSGRGFYLHNNKGTDAILKGFTITNGSASGGGAVYCEGIKFVSSPIITKCNIVGNSTRGILCHDSSPLITNCTITNNSAEYDGGGICGCDGPITNCIISDNTAERGGGISECKGPITNCTISGNTTGRNGGGLFHCYGPITNCTITRNTAGDEGGGISECKGPITNCTISGNSAEWGGGMYNFLSSSLTLLTNCTFSGNSAEDNGGGMYNGSSSPMMTNCTFSGNSAGEQGGGIYNYNRCKPTLTNCTFFGNSAPNGNACACNSYAQSRPSTVQLANCIVWDGGQVIWNNDGSTITISYTDLQGGQAACYDPCDAIEWDLGNIDADPCFVEPGYWADANDPNIIVEPNDPNAVWIDGDYHLKSQGWSWDIKRSRWTYDDVTSRCIDAGNPGCPLGDELLFIPDDPNNIWGQNLRINMGAFGGTAEASIPPYDWALLADLTNDGFVNLKDYAFQAADWLNSDNQQPGDLNRNSLIDISDFVLLVEDWLKQTTWHE